MQALAASVLSQCGVGFDGGLLLREAMGGEGRGGEAFLVMWPRLSTLNPPLARRLEYRT